MFSKAYLLKSQTDCLPYHIFHRIDRIVTETSMHVVICNHRKSLTLTSFSILVHLFLKSEVDLIFIIYLAALTTHISFLIYLSSSNICIISSSLLHKSLFFMIGLFTVMMPGYKKSASHEFFICFLYNFRGYSFMKYSIISLYLSCAE
jgi:hypothetical protein